MVLVILSENRYETAWVVAIYGDRGRWNYGFRCVSEFVYVSTQSFVGANVGRVPSLLAFSLPSERVRFSVVVCTRVWMCACLFFEWKEKNVLKWKYVVAHFFNSQHYTLNWGYVFILFTLVCSLALFPMAVHAHAHLYIGNGWQSVSMMNINTIDLWQWCDGVDGIHKAIQYKSLCSDTHNASRLIEKGIVYMPCLDRLMLF